MPNLARFQSTFKFDSKCLWKGWKYSKLDKYVIYHDSFHVQRSLYLQGGQAITPAQHIPACNHEVTVNGYEAVDKWLWSWVCQQKNFENRRLIGEDMDKSNVLCLLVHPAFWMMCTIIEGLLPPCSWLYLCMCRLVRKRSCCQWKTRPKCSTFSQMFPAMSRMSMNCFRYCSIQPTQ